MVFRGVGNGLVRVVNEFCIQHDIISPIHKEYAVDERIPLVEWYRILDYLSRYYDKDDLGIQLGLLSEPQDMGLVAYLCGYCKDVREVFEVYRRYHRVWYDVLTFDFQETDEHFVFYWDNPIYVDAGLYVKEMRTAAAVTISAFYKFISQLVLPARFEIDKVELKLPASAETNFYSSILSCPYVFDAEFNGIYFSKDMLDLKIVSPNTDEFLQKVLTHSANQQLEKYVEKISFKELINRNILEALQDNHTDVQYIAEKIGIKARLIQQRLKQYDSSYSEQLAEVRKLLAFQYLKDHSLNIGQIASMLGYQEQASFHHSFKGWTGKSPRQWRLESLEKGVA